ncbi:MAG: HD domain-containing protein [Ruminococcaceae bacterium]|nr:HD domain-containing protein [Oscillospiraceae bacterium]
MDENLNKIIAFILETDKLKNIYRQTYVTGEDRTENDAEHSFHLALMTSMMAQYSNEPIDILKTMKMVLVHDVVEIDAGDTYCYDAEAAKSKEEREVAAANRLFGILPEDIGSEFRSLWDEFERRDTPESKFAAVMDRVQPLLLNVATNGRAWKEHGIYIDQVRQRIAPVKEGSVVLWEYLNGLIEGACEKGYLKK